MSATIDVTLFSEYFNNPYIIEVEGRAYPVQEYFLEDCVELTNFVPTPDSRKRKRVIIDINCFIYFLSLNRAQGFNTNF